MQIREASHTDIPGILAVLKASLGEVSSQKTEEVWRYKHIENPFGESMVLVAEEDEKIIGVRAFMRWKWEKVDKIYSAFRAVDTATHPDHQGKGVFKKLTLKALELGKKRGDHFVFNTPNSKSKPGYLKMGWKEVDKLRIQVRPLIPLKPKYNGIENEILEKLNLTEELLLSFYENEKETGRLFTPKDIEYLKWRYVNNPMQNYTVIFDEDYFIAAYVKKRKKFEEFRISEAIILDKGKKRAKRAILKMAANSRASVLSISPKSGLSFKAGLTGNFGPTLTFKNINTKKMEEQEILDLASWNYSLGDLELF